MTYIFLVLAMTEHDRMTSLYPFIQQQQTKIFLIIETAAGCATTHIGSEVCR
jgi:hypothetical protein